MNRIFCILLVWLVPMCAWSRCEWYDEPVQLSPGSKTIGKLSANPENVVVHIRISNDAVKEAQWGLCWRYRDDNNLTYAKVVMPKEDRHEPIFTAKPTIEVVDIVEGVSHKIYEGEVGGFNVNGRFNSLKLVGDGDTATLYGGESMEHEICQVPLAGGGDVVMFNKCGVDCQLIQCMASDVPELPVADYNDMEALRQVIEDAKDPAAGFWQYLDRNTDSNKLRADSRYRLAIVPYGDALAIVYLDGARINADSWLPFMVKGLLTPTIFEGNYDLIWYDAYGCKSGEDSNAQLSDDGAILTLRFPDLSGQLRLQRQFSPAGAK